MGGREKDKDSAFLKEWNDFEFFYGALESLMVALNYDINKMKAELTTEPDGDRIFFIRFCQCVDQLYKLYDESFNFYYFDLKQPTFKKCFHVLKMLLNYLKYYEMVKKEVCGQANDTLAAYNDALIENNDLINRNAEAKQRSQETDRKMQQYETNLPLLTEKVQEFTQKIHALDKIIATKITESKEFEAMHIKLEMEEKDLQQKIVVDEEYNNKLTLMQSLQEELDNLKKINEFSRSSNTGLLRDLDNISKILDALTTTIAAHDTNVYEKLIANEEELTTAKKNIQIVEQKIKDLNDEIQKTEQEISDVTVSLEEAQNNLHSIEESNRREIKTMELEISQLQKEEDTLKLELMTVQEECREMEQLQLVIQHFLSETLFRISSIFTQ